MLGKDTLEFLPGVGAERRSDAARFQRHIGRKTGVAADRYL
jgi:hypothetical protein